MKERGARGAGAQAVPPVLVTATTDADVVEVPARLALAIDGAGPPASEPFQRSLGALYGVAYTLKFARKKAGSATFMVPPLEGRWWAEGFRDEFAQAPSGSWRWRLRMGVPADVSEAEVLAAIVHATTRRGGKLEGSSEARRIVLERIPAQRCGRILHVGPYAEEPRSFTAIASVLARAGLVPARSHLEVYLGDPRRTDPAKLRTILLRELRPTAG